MNVLTRILTEGLHGLVLALFATTAVAGGAAKSLFWTDFDSLRAAASADGSNQQAIVDGFIVSPTGIALDLNAGQMYWADGTRRQLLVANLDGSDATVLLTLAGFGALRGVSLDTGAGHLYWLDSGAGTVQRADLDGDNVQTLVSGLSNPAGLALDLDASQMYWTEASLFGPSRIAKANLDGSGITPLSIAGLDAAWGIALDVPAGKLYWTDTGANRLQRANVDGSGVEDLIVSGLNDPQNLAIDAVNGKLVWPSFNDRSIKRSNLDGSALETLLGGLDEPRAIALDTAGDTMYFTDPGTSKIQRAGLDGSGLADILAPVIDNPDDVALDDAAGHVYWTESQGQIKRANIDGSDIITVLDDLNGVGGLALDTDAGLLYWAEADGLWRANLDGSAATLLRQVFTGPTAIAIDSAGGKYYWADYTTAGVGADYSSINRMDLDGSNQETLVTVPFGFTYVGGIGLEVAAGKMYWSDYELKRANLDGSGLEILVADFTSRRGFALDSAAGEMYWIEDGRIRRAALDGSGIEDVVNNVFFSTGLALSTTGLATDCDLTLDASLAQSTLTLDFRLGISRPGTWSIFIQTPNGPVPVFSVAVPRIDPALTPTFSVPVGPVGTIALATVLSTPEDGRVCQAATVVSDGANSPATIDWRQMQVPALPQ